MELKHKLEQIFNNDYPGTERFIADVIEPIFSNEIEYINDDLAEREEYADKAKKAGIKHIRYIGNLTEKNYSADNIALLDVTLDDSKNIERSRVNIQQLIRSIMDYRQHLMIVFHYEDVANKQWRFSYAYKGNSLKDTTSAKRYTYVFGKGYRGRTAAERFQTLAQSQRKNEDFEEAFSVSTLSDEFFDKYRAYYAAFVEYITGERYSNEKELLRYLNSKEWLQWKQKDSSGQFESTFSSDGKCVRDYIKKMFGRIVFLYFLQRKGWLYDSDGNADPRYMRNLFEGAGELKNTFLDDMLELLFFCVLNTQPDKRIQEASLTFKDITILPGWEKIPFLNGGLFSQDEIDPKKCVFPAVYFDELFRFLDSYNFTIDENDQEDAEIGIDPEMLGRIFENLLEDNKDKGAYYTPKEIVDYMCRESIIAYLQDDKFSEKGNELIRKFIETLNIDLLDTKQRDYIEERLLKVKICDPAIGSGAFPMGLVNLLSKVFIVLRTYKTIDQAKMKRFIMQNSIYGVDIEQGAVDIARLRFWLAMVVEENEPQPLPNLHFKIMQGNSLVESYKGLDLSTLMRPEPGRLDYITDEGRKQLRSSLSNFFNESDHEKRNKHLVEIKNIVTNMVYNADSTINMTELDASANDQFFMWHTWFADVFENGGFDIVIGNPPYVIVASDDPFKSTYDKKYKVAGGGKRNLFHLFFEKGISVLKEGGVISFITPDTFLAGNDTSKLRKYFLNNIKINSLILYSEKDKVFKRVTQAVAVCVMLKSVPFADFTIRVQGENKLVKLSDVTEDPKFRFRWFNQAIQKIKKTKTKVCDLFDGNKGDVNLGIKKPFFREQIEANSLPLIRGIQIAPFAFSGSDQWCLKSALSKDLTSNERIVFQEVANAGLARRVKATILKDVILGDSCNYILPKSKDININAALAVVNSKVVNFYFKFYNQTNHVPIGEFKQIPFPILSMDIQNKLDGIVRQIYSITSQDCKADISSYEQAIDFIVYHLYDLTYDEVLIVDPKTPISREQYESFKLQ